MEGREFLGKFCMLVFINIFGCNNILSFDRRWCLVGIMVNGVYYFVTFQCQGYMKSIFLWIESCL